MKKLPLWIAITLAVIVYGSPVAITKAGTDPTSTEIAAFEAAKAPAPVVLHMRVTAYASVPDETDSTPFITANGTYVHDGVIASNILPFGTKVQIPALFGDKIFTVEDRMSTRIKNTIDIWMISRGQAIIFGVHTTDIVLVPTSTALGFLK